MNDLDPSPSGGAQSYASSPAHYHLLLRLVSLIYNSSPKSSEFFSVLLYSLFNDDLLKGVTLPYYRSLDFESRTDPSSPLKLRTTVSGKTSSTGLRRKRSARGAAKAESEPEIEVEYLAIPRHLAIHLRAAALLNHRDWYGAVECVRNHVDDGPLPSEGSDTSGGRRRSKGKGKRKCKVAAELNGHDVESTQERLPCLECATILAKGCEELKRFEEGREVLRNAVENHQKMGRDISPVPLPNPGTSPLLSLAHLTALSNCKDQTTGDSSKSMPFGASNPARPSSAGAMYMQALEQDPWCWEAWIGLCDIGESTSIPAVPFAASHTTIALDPIPTPVFPLPPLPGTSASDGPTSSSAIISSLLHRGRSSSTGTVSTTNTTSSPPSVSVASSATSPLNEMDRMLGIGERERRLSPLPRQGSPASHAGKISYGIGGAGSPEWLNTPAGVLAKNGKVRAAAPPAGGHDESGWGTPATGLPAFPMQFQPTAHSTPANPGDGAHPQIPSIASRLFPQLPAGAMGGHALETPNNGGSAPYEGGLGMPPVPKRSRKWGNVAMMGHIDGGGEQNSIEGGEESVTAYAAARARGGRNATGRNFSGKALGAELEDPSHQPVRRSSRLKAVSTYDYDGSGTDTPSGHGAPASQADTASSRGSRSNARRGNMSAEALPIEIQQQMLCDTWLLALVQRCAIAYAQFTRFDLRNCIRTLDSLPRKILGSTWALTLYGRCYYELANYRMAQKAFDILISLQPYRTSDMEWYSTILWHLDEQAALSHLSQRLLSISRESPQAWMAAGNGFAAQGEHNEAMRCFKRASLLDPAMAYAYTLTAHEASEIEEFERAIGYYQMAIRTDVRHYHAWFGLGRVYQKMGKLRYAEYHFRRAVAINPSNVILLCCVGTMVEKRGDLEAALKIFDTALTIEPANRMARFRRIRALVGLKRYSIALPELEALARNFSSEAGVQFLLGKVYLCTGSSVQAQIAFTRARDLNPKLATSIKTVMQTKEDEDDLNHDEAEDDYAQRQNRRRRAKKAAVNSGGGRPEEEIGGEMDMSEM